MAEHGLCQALEYVQSQLCEMIDRGEVDMSATQMGLRARFFTLLHTIPMTCRTLLHKAKEHEAFEYVLYYERVRTGVASCQYFLDSVPAGVQLLVGNTTGQLADEALGQMKRADAIADRIQTVRRMERVPQTSQVKSRLAAFHTAELSANVPGPARYLVSRTRAVFQGLRRVKRASLFENCANCNCRRLVYVGEPVESWSGAVISASTCGDAEEPTDSDSYWRDAMGNPVGENPDTRRFCSRSCSKEHTTHFSRLMPDFGLQLDADEGSARHGRARVSDAFRMALKRNETAARSMRTMRTMRTQSGYGCAVSASELKRHRKRRVRALNIDIGLLYAASIVAESNSLSRNKLLPGQCIYWRDNPLFYAKALKLVSKLYDTHGCRDAVISSMLTTPRFMEVVSARASRIL